MCAGPFLAQACCGGRASVPVSSSAADGGSATAACEAADREEGETAEHEQERRGTVRVCDPVPASGRNGAYDDERLAGYDVTYEYANRTYRTRTDYHPGDRIRVRVDVQPE